jgi:hypothetical protein
VYRTYFTNWSLYSSPTRSAIDWTPPPPSLPITTTSVSKGAHESEPRRLRFGLWPYTRRLCSRDQVRAPTARTIKYAPQPPSSTITTTSVSESAHESEPRRLGFKFWPYMRLPCSRVPPSPHHPFYHIPPTPTIALISNFSRRAQIRAPAVRFPTFDYM